MKALLPKDVSRAVAALVLTCLAPRVAQANSIADALAQEHKYDATTNSLYLSRKQISSWVGLEQVVALYPNTRDLYLCDNQLESPLDGVLVVLANLTNLRGLQLSKNRIRLLPNDLGEIASLEMLIVENNEIEQFPCSIARLPKIKYISLRANKITNMPTFRELGAIPREGARICLLDNPLREEPGPIIKKFYYIEYSPPRTLFGVVSGAISSLLGGTAIGGQ